MQAQLIYAAKAIIYSVIFFGYYCLALRNKRFHYYNRFYLLLSAAFSLLLPLMKIELWQWHSANPPIIQLLGVGNSNNVETVISGKTVLFNWENIPFVLYAAMVLYLLLALVSGVQTIFRFRRKYGVEKIEDVNFINTELEQAPFSFFNNLFWKSSLSINENSGQQIFKHELAHIRQKHSWDKLFFRILTSLFWFNPVYWLMQKELALVHEFIADEKAIEDKNAEAFALMILQSQHLKNIFSPAQSFSYSPIKRRLVMLTTSNKTSFSYARRILVLPLLAITIFLFSFKLKRTGSESVDAHTNAPFVLVVDAGHGGSDNGAVGGNNVMEKDITLRIAKKIDELSSQYGIAVKLTRTSDATVSLQERTDFIAAQKTEAAISIHLNSSQGQMQKSNVDVFVTNNENMSTYQQSRLLGSSLLQSAQKDFPVSDMLKQRNGRSIFILDNTACPIALIECGFINNTGNVKSLLTDAGLEQMARDILTGVTAYANSDKAKQSDAIDNNGRTSEASLIVDTTGKKAPLYLVDGKETSVADAQKIDANTIQSVNVIKGDEAAIKKYGEKAANGVVIITLKKNMTSDEATATQTQAQSPLGIKANQLDSVLIVLDGKVIQSKELYLMSPNDIESINVLKDEKAVQKYGKKGSKGAIEITSKKEAGKSKPVVYFAAPTTEKDDAESSDTSVEGTTPKEENYEKTFVKTQTPAKFPGGDAAWSEYLQKNLKTDMLARKKAPIGTYKVTVSFIVGNDGTISEAKALNDPGYGTGAEAVRVIAQGPKWVAAIQNGKSVAYRQKQTITFQVK